MSSCEARDRALGLEPDLGPAYLRRSQTHRALGDPLKADEDLGRARELGLEDGEGEE